MTLNTLTYLGLMIFAGMAFGRLAKHIKLPNVTGYLVAGLILGPVSQMLLGSWAILPADFIDSLGIVSDIALGFIAFSIGGEFKVSYFKRVGAMPIIIAVMESLFAVIFVVLALLACGKPLDFSLALGSIAAATAPAATIMVIKQYHAKGPVTETLLSVVALDDATALMFYSIAVSIAQSLSGKGLSMTEMVLKPVWQILGAFLVGGILGLIFCLPLRFFHKDGNRLSLIVGFVFAAIGLSKLIDTSSLLTCMAMSATFCNFSSEDSKIMALADNVTPPIFMLFFVLSGADLDLHVLPTIGLVGVIYLVFRVLGKAFGATLGAILGKADATTKKWLGPCLLPQAGVAIGLSLSVTQMLPAFGSQIRAVILCATLIYELIGPGVTKFSLTKAKEITE